jgi:hypothetical protein
MEYEKFLNILDEAVKENLREKRERAEASGGRTGPWHVHIMSDSVFGGVQEQEDGVSSAELEKALNIALNQSGWCAAADGGVVHTNGVRVRRFDGGYGASYKAANGTVNAFDSSPVRVLTALCSEVDALRGVIESDFQKVLSALG